LEIYHTLSIQQNLLAHLRRTLEDLSSADRQRSYKAQVPFIHVPDELIEQWSGYVRLLREQGWFHALLGPEQVAAMLRFDARVSCSIAELGGKLPDVPDILEQGPWRDLGREARNLLALLPDAG
jgi:hypothetical protein